MATAWSVLVNSNVNTGPGSANSNFTGPQDISPTPQYSLAANQLIPGSVIRILAEGVFSNTGTPTLILSAYYGGAAGTALATGGTLTTITAASSWRWRYEYEGGVTARGTSGSIMGGGILLMPATLTQPQTPYYCPAVAQVAVTIDTTVAKSITMGATWGAASLSNTITCNKFFVEVISPV